ncbi:VWA domain-containing protein [Streptomyces sp. SID13666]|uniref:VWA domain-containing protein n=1 Tax=Streptomyces fildesensis TaxID=375757 RepID=A0ABW8CD37_9ACTN|nr:MULTISPECIES: VWA domain-containing protein [Streptomyces]MCM2419441.1 VWA domain-containing protein [Streptomyces sp. RKAG293]MCM2428361.1 VWA domain-containing protein [Streptomyces sp. RKAG337]MCZ4102025.1 VWA domain-containing protein [Streptomyces sp. H39-C1]NEA58083.1 VWA domain-containing protein [Streptomyces sp. SID13666]NEA74087.1 VWA domain-containing protein [Streptomyces sp. SID13588]
MANFSKSNVPQFSVDIYQNEYLPEGGREVNAIVTVTSTGGGTSGGHPLAAPGYATDGAPGGAVVIMVDCSGSMDYPPTKMRNARDATAAAIDTIRDGVAFAVVGGTHQAREVYPANGGLAVADAQTRGQAKQALRKLTAGGGTAIGTWLRLADRLLATADVPIRHGILLTDGRNEHEKPEDLRATLEACAGRFTCDARGVGTDWEVKELTGIASAMLGSVDIVADPAGLKADFQAMMETAMGKEVADVGLRLWTPQGSEIKFVKQVAPTVEDLTARRTEAGPRAGDYPTGSWGDESRDYHVCVQVPNAGVGQEMLAARLSLVLPQPDGTSQVLSQGLVRAVWTDDMAASTRINPQVAHYTGQAELASVIQEGLEARKSGDIDGATAKLGRAVQLASASGNDDTAKLLAKVVDVVDAPSGTVRLKARVADADEMTLETRSTKTVRVKK